MPSYLNESAGLAGAIMGIGQNFREDELRKEEEARRKKELEDQRAYAEKMDRKKWERSAPDRQAKATLDARKIELQLLKEKNAEIDQQLKVAAAKSTSVQSLGGGAYNERTPVLDEKGNVTGYTNKIGTAPRQERPVAPKIFTTGEGVFSLDPATGSTVRLGSAPASSRSGGFTEKDFTKAAGEIAKIDSMPDAALIAQYARDPMSRKGLDAASLRRSLRAPHEMVLAQRPQSGEKAAPQQKRPGLLGAIGSGGARLMGGLASGLGFGNEGDIAGATMEGSIPPPVGAAALSVLNKGPASIAGATSNIGSIPPQAERTTKKQEDESTSSAPTLDEFISAAEQHKGSKLTPTEIAKATARYRQLFEQE